MLVVIVALVVGALLLVCGTLVSSISARREFASHPDAFRCKLHTLAAPVPPSNSLQTAWPRIACHARWVHDSLVVASGLWRIKVQPYGVHFAEGTVGTAAAHEVSGLGPQPVLLLLQLDDDTRVVLAAPASARSLVCGPYLVAQVTAEVGRSSDRD